MRFLKCACDANGYLDKLEEVVLKAANGLNPKSVRALGDRGYIYWEDSYTEGGRKYGTSLRIEIKFNGKAISLEPSYADPGFHREYRPRIPVQVYPYKNKERALTDLRFYFNFAKGQFDDAMKKLKSLR